RVGQVWGGTEALGALASTDPVSEVTALVQDLQVVAFDVGSECLEIGAWCCYVDNRQAVVGGKGGDRATRPLIELTASQRDTAPVGIAGQRRRRSLPVAACPDGVGDQGVLTFGADDQPRRLRRRLLGLFGARGPRK